MNGVINLNFVETLRKKGNDCMSKGNYIEAIKNYSEFLNLGNS